MQPARQLRLIEENSKTELPLAKNLKELSSLVEERYSPYPNECLTKFINKHKTSSKAVREATFHEVLSAGKNSYTYDAHTYHTKVPPEAILQLVEHYTQPGDLVLDPFCGSGMTGVAALQVGRKPVLVDLSPAATFIARNFLTHVDPQKFMEAVRAILAAVREEELAIYGTHCRHCGERVPIEYVVWSYGVKCVFCGNEFLLWDAARDEKKDVRESKIRTEFECPHCTKTLIKRVLKRTEALPVLVGYRCCRSGLQESKARPDSNDLHIINVTDKESLPDLLVYPSIPLPHGVNTRQAIAHGLSSVDKLYTKRNLRAVARLWDIARRWADEEMSAKLMFTVTSLYQRVTRLSEFRFWGGSGNIANYNVPTIFNEQNVFKVFYRKARTIQKFLEAYRPDPTTSFCISTQSATNLWAIPDDSTDYIFTDPPFGANINYSEMNFLWEAWFGMFTDPRHEVIVNRVQGKTVEDYQALFTKALKEMYRVLKPHRWLTLVFHNSSASVWTAIQTSLRDSGFSVSQTQILDKRHGTFKQFVSDNAVGYDLMLHCQKQPKKKRENCSNYPATEQSIREYVVQALKMNPEQFVLRYLHVNRKNEVDVRKLYSLWLTDQMKASKPVEVSFDLFRRLVLEVISRAQIDTEGLRKVRPDK